MTALDDIDNVDRWLIEAAFRGQLGWDTQDGPFVWVLGPHQGRTTSQDVADRIERMTAAGLLTFDRSKGFSCVVTTPEAWPLPIVDHVLRKPPEGLVP
jgi:hypothetical protein